MEKILEEFKGIVKSVTEKEVELIITETQKEVLDASVEYRTFPKTLFNNDVKVDDEFICVIKGGNGFMELTLRQIHKPLNTKISENQRLEPASAEPIFKQIKAVEINPKVAGWYNTDKGLLFWYKEESNWSCRDDRMSEEYPKFWYEKINY